MLREGLTVASFVSALGFGVVTLFVNSYVLGFLLSLIFLVVSLCYFNFGSEERREKEEEKVTVYGHPEGNIVKRG